MGSYAGDHNASRPQTGKRTTNNFDEPKQQRHLGTASNEITWGGGGGGGGCKKIAVDQPSPLVLPCFLRHLVVRFAWKMSSS